ncbi:uncharacterized protein LOC130729392 [Lotus japonicus]|uniref:uncharacterized protein LOC130729392 n=1 Tax=Lotus japonicus TaxID=34305 RepID=UPI00258D3CC3|nr:uncharacterized protein LOC130729392 [Lotus japonicus]
MDLESGTSSVRESEPELDPSEDLVDEQDELPAEPKAPPEPVVEEEGLPELVGEEWVEFDRSKAERKVQRFFCLAVESYDNKEGDIYRGLRTHMLIEFTNESIPNDESAIEDEDEVKEEDEDDEDDESEE